jgi:hypothetical protein
MTRSTRAAEARADRHRRPSGSPPGALPVAISIYVARRVRSAAGRTVATTWHAASRIRASARCCPGDGRHTRRVRRARIAADDHQDRLRRPSRRLSASTSRGASVAPQGAQLRPHGEQAASLARPPMAASATPRPGRERPRADRRRGSPRPPPGALAAAIGICVARHARCAAARSAATTRRAASSVGASGCGRICHAAAEAPEAARRSPPPTTTAASWGDPRV